MASKPRKRAIIKARKRLIIHYKRAYKKESRNMTDSLLALAKVFNKAMNSRKEIEK